MRGDGSVAGGEGALSELAAGDPSLRNQHSNVMWPTWSGEQVWELVQAEEASNVKILGCLGAAQRSVKWSGAEEGRLCEATWTSRGRTSRGPGCMVSVGVSV